MVAAKFFAFAALAVGAIAAPLSANEGKPFKFSVLVDGKTLFLNEAGTAVADQDAGVTCTINAGVIGCGAQKLGYTYGTLSSPPRVTTRKTRILTSIGKDNSHTPTNTPLTPVARAPENKGWSIGPDNEIKWAAKSGGDVHFSTRPRQSNKIYAEICSTYGHLDKNAFVPRQAKAVFV